MTDVIWNRRKLLFNSGNLEKTLNTLFVRKRTDLNLLLSLDKENGADSAQSMTGQGREEREHNLFVYGLSFSGNEFGRSSFYVHFEPPVARRDTLNKTSLKNLSTWTV